MNKVLFITYYFPPLAGMGSIRLARFARYLPEFGWTPTVLTTDTIAAQQPCDHDLVTTIPSDVEIHRVNPLFDTGKMQQRLRRVHLGLIASTLRRLLSQIPPEGELGVAWSLSAYARARRILAHDQVDAIVTCSPPCAAHVVGYMLKRTTGKPWVADFRDEWSKHPHRRFILALSTRLDAWLERQVLRDAEHIVTATEAYRTGFASLLSGSSSADALGKVTTITHGYDPADFIELATGRSPGPAGRHKFNIVYSGTLWGGIGFLKALQRLLASGEITNETVEVTIVGRIRPIWRLDGASLVEKLEILGPLIREVGWVSHRESIRYISQADLLLLVLDSNRGADTIPGKTYEYLASGRPVLAVVPPLSEVARILKQTNSATIVADGDVPAIARAIMELYGQWKQGNLVGQPRRDMLQPYDARSLACSLAGALDRAYRS